MRDIKIAINGFGRIGRAFFKLAEEHPELSVIAVNDIGNIENLVYLLKHDSAYRNWAAEVSVKDEHTFLVNGRPVAYISEKDPSKLPWKVMGIDVAVESSGLFASFEKAKVHLDAGAKRVVISAPAKDEPPEGLAGATVLLGVNEDKLSTCSITSNASCTTNAASPLIAILHEKIGIEKAILNTIHGYTASQSLVDGPTRKENVREGRAAAVNIVPSSTGAAIAVTKAFPALEGLFDGISVRVPVLTGSIVDVTFVAKRDTTKEEINQILTAASNEERWKGVFSVTKEPIVSSDIIGLSFASLADLAFTRVVAGNLVKVMAWYDNEMGYTHTLVEHVSKIGAKIQSP